MSSMLTGIVKKYKKIPIEGKASFWFLISNFLIKGIAFITTPIFTRLLSTSDYGVINVFSSWQTIFMIFATLNLSGGVYTRGLLDYDNKRFTAAIQGLSTTVGGGVFVILWIGRDFFCEMLEIPHYILLALCIYMISFPGMEYWVVKQRFSYKYKMLTVVSIGSSVSISVLSVIAVALFPEKIEAKIFVTLLIGILWALPFYFCNFAKGKVFFDREIWKYALGFNLPLIFHYLSNVVLNQSDRVMIKTFSGSGDAGIYSLAYSIAVILQVFNDAIIATFTPWRYQKLKNKEFSEVNRMSLALLVLVGGLVLGIIALTPEAIYILAPEEYYEAIYIVPPLAMSVMFMFVYNFFACVEFYMKKTKYMMYFSSVLALANIALNYLFMNLWGYIGCAYATLVCYIAFCVIHYIAVKRISRREFGVDVYNIKLIVLLCAGILLTGFLLMVLYEYLVAKYMLIAVGIVVVWLNRKKIGAYIGKLKSCS